MAKWLRRLQIILMLLFAVIYVLAKIHLFRRFGVLSIDQYFNEHYPYTLGLFAILGIIWLIDRAIRFLERDQETQQ